MLTSPGYRADIDGLRAIAVLSVMTFHAFPGLLPGGFIGVDVFFVISGYLITLIVFSNLRDGTFSYAEFYARRIRRIFPALILVLATTLATGWFVLLPDEYRNLGKHVAAGAGFMSNFALLRESGYFDASAETKPLLHLWSLAVEEQFYLVWPLLLAAAWRMRRVTTAILVVGVLSFAANVHTVALRPEAAFYLPHTRFWELMAGGLLATLALRDIRPPPRRASHISVAGMLLLATGLFAIDRQSRFPGWWALLPTFGAFLLIWAGPGAIVNRRVMAAPAMVYVGKISYPLYLWHWALLVLLAMHALGNLGVSERVGAIAVATVLSVATYHLVEMPIRVRRRFAATLSFAMSALLAMGLSMYLSEGRPERLRAEQLAVLHHFDYSLPERPYFVRHEIPRKYRDDCNFYDIEAFRTGHATREAMKQIAPSCYTPSAGRKTVLLWGDSHAQQLNPGLTARLGADWQVLQVASSGCNPDAANASRESRDYCRLSNAFALETIAKAKPEVVVLAQEGDHRSEVLMQTAAEIRRLSAAKVLIMGPVPHWKPVLHKILVRKWEQGLPRRLEEGLDREVLELNARLRRAIPGTGPVRYVDVIAFFCDAGGCLSFIGDDPVAGLSSFDYGHLTQPASELLAEKRLVPLIRD